MEANIYAVNSPSVPTCLFAHLQKLLKIMWHGGDGGHSR